MTFEDGAGDLGAFNLMPCRLRVHVVDAGAAIDVHVRVAPAAPGWILDTDL